MSSVRTIEREFQHHSQRIERVNALARQLATETRANHAHLTRNALADLEAINRDIAQSSLPPAHKGQLQAQVETAMRRHAELLDQATQHAQAVLQHAAAQPLPQRTGLDDFVDSIDDTLHALTGGLFRRK